MAALTLNAAPQTRPIDLGGRLGLVLPVPILVVLCWIHLLVVLVPLGGAAHPVYRARLAYPAWIETCEPRWSRAMESSATPDAKLKAAIIEDDLLSQLIIQPLQSAAESEPGDANLRVELAYWCGKGRDLFIPLREADLKDRKELNSRRAKYSVQTVGHHIRAARAADPLGKSADWLGSQLWLRFAQEPGFSQREQSERYLQASRHLERLAKRDPGDLWVLYLLTHALMKVGSSDATDSARQYAEQAAILANQPGAVPTILSQAQQQQLQEWSKPPKEGG
jgi:hypothetical protein